MDDAAEVFLKHPPYYIKFPGKYKKFSKSKRKLR